MAALVLIEEQENFSQSKGGRKQVLYPVDY